MSKRSPSADDDDRDRFEVTKSRKRSSNKGGGGGSIQSKENCSLSPFVQAVDATSQNLQKPRMMVEQQALEIQRQALEIQRLGLGRGEVPYMSPSTDEDDGDRTKQAMLWEKESDDEVPCASLSADEDDCDQKLPSARPAVLSTDTVIEIIHLVSQQSKDSDAD